MIDQGRERVLEEGQLFLPGVDDHPARYGIVSIYLPDGHLERGGLQYIWTKYVGLPYPDSSDGRQYSVTLPRKRLPKGLRSRSVKEVRITVARPHDTPHSRGICGSGEDWLREELGIGAQNGTMEDYEGALKEKDRELLVDTGIRPSYLLLALRDDLNVSDMDDLADRVRDDLGVLFIATEYPFITYEMFAAYGMKPFVMPRGRAPEWVEFPPETNVVIRTIRGAAEGHVQAGDAHGILDVAESGHTIEKNNLNVIRPKVLRSTAQLVVDETTAECHPRFVKEVRKRMRRGVRKDRKDNAGRYRDKLTPELLAKIS